MGSGFLLPSQDAREDLTATIEEEVPEDIPLFEPRERTGSATSTTTVRRSTRSSLNGVR